MTRRILRHLINFLALYFAFAVQHAASGNLWASIITAAAVGAYGMWCFYDGAKKP